MPDTPPAIMPASFAATSGPNLATLGDPRRWGGVSPDFNLMEDLFPSSAVADFSSRIIESTETVQQWKNLVSSPNDGDTQANWMMNLGADSSPSTDDPVLTGIPGEAGTHYALDGTQFFTASASGGNGNPNQLKRYHRTDSSNPTTICMLFKTGTLSGTYYFFANRGGGALGIRNYHFAGNHKFEHGGDSSQSSDLIGTPLAYTNDTLFGLIKSFNAGGVITEKFWNNVDSSPRTWDLTTTVATADPTDQFHLCSNSVGGQIMPSAGKMYEFQIFNEEWDDTKAAILFAEWELRTGLSILA